MSAIETVDPPREHRISSFLARLAVQWKPNRVRSIVIVAASILLIGWVDFKSGRRVTYTLFYTAPVAVATMTLGAPAGCVAALASVVVSDIGDIPLRSRRVPLPIILWDSFTDLVMLTLLVWFTHGLITLYREVDERVAARTRDLEEANRNRLKLENELLEVAARERVAMGQEIHDELCQQLVGTAFATRVLADELATRDAIAARSAEEIVHHLEGGLARARQIASGLLLDHIPPAELPEALAELTSSTTRAGVPCRFVQQGAPAIADAATASQLFRIAQEAVRNAVRHAKPTRIEIVLGGNRDATFLLVKDDGCGLPPAGEREAGMGLRIMEKRAARAGGVLSIRTAAGKGTTVVCHLPGRQPSP